MARPQKVPLRRLAAAERRDLARLSRSCTAPAAEVTRSALILLVSDGRSFQDAARAAGRKSGDAVARLVARFNREGVAAVTPGHGGGRSVTYVPEARDRILREAARTPTPTRDGTATWSLAILRRVLRKSRGGLPRVSTYTIWRVLHEEGISWQATRTWSETGKVERKNRRTGEVKQVTDPDAAPKKS